MQMRLRVETITGSVYEGAWEACFSDQPARQAKAYADAIKSGKVSSVSVGGSGTGNWTSVPIHAVAALTVQIREDG